MGVRKIRTERMMDAEVIAQNDTHYTKGVNFDRGTGEVGMLIVSTAGKVTISQQCSLLGASWYDPVGPSGNQIGIVCTGVLVTTGTWVSYDPVVAPHIRFKIVEKNVAATSVTIDMITQEE